MINAAELAALRNDAENGLTASCTISSPGALSADGAGGYSTGTPTTHGPYACRVEQSNRSSDTLPVVANGVSPRRYVYVVLPVDAVVSAQDTVVIGARRLLVEHVPDRTLSILLRVQCWESA